MPLGEQPRRCSSWRSISVGIRSGGASAVPGPPVLNEHSFGLLATTASPTSNESAGGYSRGRAPPRLSLTMPGGSGIPPRPVPGCRSNFDNRGVGASTGKTPDTIQAMAKDAVMFIRALGFDQVDLHGFSMGGILAQVIARDEPELVRKLILTGSGPAGGKGMKEVVWVAQLDTLRGLLSRQDPKQFLFFTRTANGKHEGKAFLARLQERTIDRDTAISVSSYFAQLKACRRWGKEEPHDLSLIGHPVLLANGDNDRMLSTPNTLDMARRLPNNELVIYPDAGHGGIFQFHEQFVEKALQFLAK
jgi:pimeloyl-ACP methyl ester carboxylesterase